MSKTTFIWAQGQDANVREPIKELAEKGWQHRDIPKASNMNWVFKQISDEFVALRKEVEQHATELKSKLDEQASTLQKQEEALGSLKTELGTLNENHSKLNAYTKRHLAKAFRDNEFNNGISRQLCETLREMERLIRHYHRDFPNLPWPLYDQAVAEVVDEGES